MPKCINVPSRTYKGTEPSPKGLGYCAHSEKIGTKKKGLDGNIWEIKRNKKGINRWIKVNSNKKKETILLNTFISKYILPIIKNWDYDTTFDNISKNDIIEINYDEKRRYIVEKNLSKNNKVDLVIRFEPTQEEVQTKKFILKEYYNNTKKNKKEFDIKLIKDNLAEVRLSLNKDEIENIDILENKLFNEAYEKVQNQKIKNYLESGVIFTKAPKSIVNKLEKEIDLLAKKTKKDYHPFSDDKVRDLVHPSLYPYIKGVSKIKNLDENIDKQESEGVDFWNRPYEYSKYQWLPTEFFINKNGKCKIDGYINNLPGDFLDLRNSLERLFEKILPSFEKIYNYIYEAQLHNDTEIELYGGNEYCKVKKSNRSLRNRVLQVIPKIVTCELNDGRIDGAWHVEGMSHENIIATAVTVIDQTDNFNAELKFKRRFTLCEVEKIVNNTGQHRPYYLNEFFGYGQNEEFLVTENYKGSQITGLIPLGKVKTQKYSLTVFPNSHIHKIDMENLKKKNGKRTIVVFWLVNPDVKIISTKNIDEQQKNIKLKNAKKHRIKLMEERKYYKQNFNVRDLNLCEH